MPSSPESVTVHPLVLLSVVDHYNRVAKDTKKRVVGVLLGSVSKGEVDVTNSFAGSIQTSLCIGTQCCSYWLIPPMRASSSDADEYAVLQCLSRKTLKIQPSGSWITATWKQ